MRGGLLSSVCPMRYAVELMTTRQPKDRHCFNNSHEDNETRRAQVPRIKGQFARTTDGHCHIGMKAGACNAWEVRCEMTRRMVTRAGDAQDGISSPQKGLGSYTL